MDLQLNGKRALVTGSSAGIGEAIAKTLAAEGVKVVVNGRNTERAERVAEAIRGSGARRPWRWGTCRATTGRRTWWSVH